MSEKILWPWPILQGFMTCLCQLWRLGPFLPSLERGLDLMSSRISVLELFIVIYTVWKMYWGLHLNVFELCKCRSEEKVWKRLFLDTFHHPNILLEFLNTNLKGISLSITINALNMQRWEFKAAFHFYQSFIYIDNKIVLNKWSVNKLYEGETTLEKLQIWNHQIQSIVSSLQSE